MARMSIDDKFLRDGRVKLLGQRMGWSRRETMGALLDVFAIAYDREDDVLPDAEIDAAADKQGFAEAMIEVGLGERDGHHVRIRGAAERIEYLAKKREAGAKGGRKSGESRRNRNEAKRSSASEAREAFGNPPDPVPDLPPDPVPDQIPDLSHHAHAIPPVPAQPVAHVPAVPPTIPGDGGELFRGHERPHAKASGGGGHVRQGATAQGAVLAAGNVEDPHIGPTAHRTESPSSPDFSDRDPKPTNASPPGESDWHKRRRWWALMLEADLRIRAAGIEPNAPQLLQAPAGEVETNMAICARTLREAGCSDSEIDAKMRHLPLVAEAAAMRTRSRRWFKPALIWDPKRAARDWDTSLAEASTEHVTRAGPHGSAARAPEQPRKIQTLNSKTRSTT